MSQTPEQIPVGLQGVLGAIHTAEAQGMAYLSEAEKQQQNADRLSALAPTLVDRPIEEATRRLIELAKSGEISARATLLGALLINKYQPSRTKGGAIKRQDVKNALDNFDSLTPGTPVIDKFRGPWDYYGGVVTDHPVSVIPSVGQGMGDRPEAEIRFGYKPIVFSRNSEPELQNEEIQTIRFRRFTGLTIGTPAVQSLLESQIITPKGILARQARGQTIESVAKYSKIAHLFNTVLGDILQVEELDAFLQHEREISRSNKELYVRNRRSRAGKL